MENSYQSFIVRMTGNKGSGKSLLLAYYGLTDLCRGRKVWSNMPITVSKHFAESHLDKSKAGLKSEPLDWDALYSFDHGLVEGTVLIDEAQYFSDSRSSMSLKNRLLNGIMAQVRKRKLNVYYTVKQGDWVDKRLTYETDVSIFCFNASYSDWGKRIKLPNGMVIKCVMYDLSGVVSGKTVYQTSKPIKKWLFKRAYLVWDCYDTSQVQDIEEMYTPVRMDMKERVISNKESASGILENTVLRALFHFRNQGYKDVKSSELWEYLEAEEGITYSPGIGKYIPNIVKRKQKADGSHVYDLSAIITTTSE